MWSNLQRLWAQSLFFRLALVVAIVGLLLLI